MVKGWRRLTRIVNDELEKFRLNSILTKTRNKTLQPLRSERKAPKNKTKNKTEQTIHV